MAALIFTEYACYTYNNINKKIAFRHFIYTSENVKYILWFDLIYTVGKHVFHVFR